MKTRDSRWILLLLMATGVGSAYTGLLLTDQFFASLLTAGIAYGFSAVRNASLKMMLLHIMLTGYAAQVRPTLSLFFVADFFFLYYLMPYYKLEKTKKRLFIIFFSVFTLSILGNAPSIRNYLNHGLFTASDVLSNNFARYLAGPVMIKEGRSEEYKENLSKFRHLKGQEKIDAQNKFSFSMYMEYPKATAKRIFYHILWNSYDPHWEYILNVFGHGFKLNNIYHTNEKINKTIFICIPFFIYYSIVFLLFLISILPYRLTINSFSLFSGSIFFALPFFVSFINGQGARMRLYIEPVVLAIAFNEFYKIIKRYRFVHAHP